ncbi:MAG: hypothetical protein N3G21_12630 [Candidatus Hydrogenedentes bacterium]|nr:hypothetical protein [Candidatus Hydrogenedentota bacterium]
MKGRNELQLAVEIDGKWVVSHFNLKEFENTQGWAMVHSSVVLSLEKLRAELSRLIGEEVEILITSSTRTEEENNRLGKIYGWITEGGVVSKDSKHLDKYGGVAVDFYVRTKEKRLVVSEELVANTAVRFFDFVKRGYPDGHIHADNRKLLNK